VDKDQALGGAGLVAAIVCILVLAIPTERFEYSGYGGDIECGSVINRDSDSSRCDGPINQRKVIAVIVGGAALALLGLAATSSRVGIASGSMPVEGLEIFCSNCEAKVSESAKFCPSCGFSFKEKPGPCPNPECEAIPAEGAAFCDQCGTDLKAET
jgi:hypothetical protein